MIRNYFTVGWRNLINNLLHSVINLFGLAVGVSSCLVIYLMVQFELSFNRNIPDADQIFRIHTTFKGDFSYANRGIELGARTMAKEQLTGLECAVAMHTYFAKVTVPENKTDFETQRNIVVTEPEYFKLIQGYEWVEGGPESSLSKPMQVVLTDENAKKYFGTGDVKQVMGREIHYDSLVLTVSGIVKPLRYRTDFDFTDFISLKTVEKSYLKESFGNEEGVSSSNLLFIRKKSTRTMASLEAQVQKISDKYNELHKSEYGKVAHKLQPLHDLHYNSELGTFDNGRDPAHKDTLALLSIVAFLLLLTAAINFINLETAQAVMRAKEVGVRKVLGGSRFTLLVQFLTQSMLLSAIAVMLALPLAELGLIFFSDFIPKGVAIDISQPSVSLFLVGIVVAIGVLAGAYPAFVMSSFLPALALKNQAYINSANTRSAFMRKGLIVLQFAFAQILMIGTAVLISQINFMLNKDLGFKKDAIIYFNTPRNEDYKRITLKGELSQIPEVSDLSLCGTPPAAEESMSALMVYKGAQGEIKTDVGMKFGDGRYLPLYDLKLIAGRNLLPSEAKKGILINEAYLKELGLAPAEVLGKEIWQNKNAFSVVGVVGDFHMASLRTNIKPVLIVENPDLMRRFSIKLNTGGQDNSKFKHAIDKIEAAYKKVYPDKKFSYAFVDDTIRSFYETEQRMSKLATTAMTIAIVISCMGLFGLVSFTAIQRTKEIGIRKVLGATGSNIVMLLSSDFLKLVCVAFIIAGPIAFYESQKFLEDYAFRIQVSWQLFAIGGLASLMLAFITVCYHAIKAAAGNPVESLRSE